MPPLVRRGTEAARDGQEIWTERGTSPNLPSRHVTEGPGARPAITSPTTTPWGPGTREIAQPFVGVASCVENEAAPCNTALMRQAHAVKVRAMKSGWRDAARVLHHHRHRRHRDAMGHEGMRSSLVSREVIADSVELTIRGHGYDALVGVAGCDKSLPGMLMAACCASTCPRCSSMVARSCRPSLAWP